MGGQNGNVSFGQEGARVPLIDMSIKKCKPKLEKRIARTASANAKIIEWMVMRASTIFNAQRVGHGGKMAHKRLKSEGHHQIQLECGEQVLAKRAQKGMRTRSNGALSSRCAAGTFVWDYTRLLVNT